MTKAATKKSAKKSAKKAPPKKAAAGKKPTMVGIQPLRPKSSSKQPADPAAAAAAAQRAKTLLSDYEGAYENYIELTSLKGDAVRSSMQFYYRLGEVLEPLYKRYQKGGVKAMVQALNINGDAAGKAIRMVKMYPRAEFDKLIDTGIVNWSHMRLLVSVDEPKKRQQVEKALISSGGDMDWRKLDVVIQKLMGGSRSNRSRVGPAKTLAKNLARWIEMTGDWNEISDRVWLTTVAPELDTLPEESVSDLERLKDNLTAMIERAEASRERVNEAIAAKENRESADADNAQAEEDLAEQNQQTPRRALQGLRRRRREAVTA